MSESLQHSVLRALRVVAWLLVAVGLLIAASTTVDRIHDSFWPEDSLIEF